MTLLVYLWQRTFNTSLLNTHKHHFQSHSLPIGAITCCSCRNKSSCPSPCNITCGWTELSEFTHKWFYQLLSSMSPLSAFQTTQGRLNPRFKEPSLDGQPASRSVGKSSEKRQVHHPWWQHASQVLPVLLWDHGPGHQWGHSRQPG